MVFFRVGMRVKMVRSITGIIPVGSEGTVKSIVPGLRVKQGYIAEIGVEFHGVLLPLFSEIFCTPSQLEPIIDKHEPCESEFKQSLDRLLEKVGERVG